MAFYKPRSSGNRADCDYDIRWSICQRGSGAGRKVTITFSRAFMGVIKCSLGSRVKPWICGVRRELGVAASDSGYVIGDGSRRSRGSKGYGKDGRGSLSFTLPTSSEVIWAKRLIPPSGMEFRIDKHTWRDIGDVELFVATVPIGFKEILER